jgi:hypothetical protein
VGIQASTEHVRELAFPKSKISSSKPWHVGLAVLKLKWPACMSRGRSAARDRRWRGALSRYIMSLPEPVGVTYICHGLTHVRAGAPSAWQRQES